MLIGSHVDPQEAIFVFEEVFLLISAFNDLDLTLFCVDILLFTASGIC
jgi:hypothetical protein